MARIDEQVLANAEGEAMADERPVCFIAMPLTTPIESVPAYGGDVDHFRHVMEHLFVPACEQAGYRPVRPRMRGAQLIHAEIIKQLEEAELVLCDLSGHNPNVFFELGIRTALDRPVALVRDDKTEQLAFDTSILNTHAYDSSLTAWTLPGQVDRLARHLRDSAERSDGSNPMWKYFGLTQRAEKAEPGENPLAAKVDLLLSEVQRFGAALPTLMAGDPPPAEGDATGALDFGDVDFINEVLLSAARNNLTIRFRGKRGGLLLFATPDFGPEAANIVQSAASRHGRLAEFVAW